MDDKGRSGRFLSPTGRAEGTVFTANFVDAADVVGAEEAGVDAAALLEPPVEFTVNKTGFTLTSGLYPANFPAASYAGGASSSPVELERALPLSDWVWSGVVTNERWVDPAASETGEEAKGFGKLISSCPEDGCPGICSEGEAG